MGWEIDWHHILSYGYIIYGTYDGTELRSTDGTADGKFEGLLMGASLGSLDGL